MLSNRKRLIRNMVFICTALLATPMTAIAASDEEMSEMRAQIIALAERLDRLEAENHQLVTANSELLESHQQNVEAIAEVSEKTGAAVAEVQQQAEKTNWTDTIRWKGDFRYRYESFNIEGLPYRHRNRVRARAALVADINDNLEVGLGIASGGDDPVSSNQTLGGGNSTKDLSMDLAYFDWSGLSGTHIIAGKFKNFLHRSGNNALLWDGDWRPEGSGVNWANNMFFANAVGTWIESDTDKGQTFGYALQGGIKFPVGDSLKVTGTVGYYVFDTAGMGSFFGDDDDFFGNSFNPISKTYLYDYQELELSLDLNFHLFDRPAMIFADFVQNQAVSRNNNAWAAGFTYGTATAKGNWALGYVYQRLEADAAFGLLTDSDFGGGGTNAKGHILKGSYAIAKNWNANVTYFINQIGIKKYQDPRDFNRLQLDMSFKY